MYLRDRDVAGTRSQCSVVAPRIAHLVLGTGESGSFVSSRSAVYADPEQDITPLCRRYRSCVRSLSKSHCIQAAPLAGHSPVLIRTQRLGSCCCYTRGAQSKLLYSIASAVSPLMRTWLLAVARALSGICPRAASREPRVNSLRHRDLSREPRRRLAPGGR